MNPAAELRDGFAATQHLARVVRQESADRPIETGSSIGTYLNPAFDGVERIY
jgi:hypothetical protein